MKEISHDLNSLKMFPLLRDIHEESLKDFLKLCVSKTWSRGEIIYSSAREKESRIFFLLSGKVKIVEINDKGVEIPKEIIGDNEIFGTSVASNSALSTFEYAQVLTQKAFILSISQANFNDVLKKNPLQLLTYTSSLISKIQRLESRYATFALSDAKERLIYLLTEMASKDHVNRGGSVVVRNYLTQDEIAKMIFVSRQTLSRMLKDLKETGEVSYKRGKIEITSPLLAGV